MKRKLFIWVLTAIFVLSVFPAVAFAGGLAGSGTEQSPYLIKTKADIDLVRNDLSAYYRMENDIAFAAADFAAGGAFYNGGQGFLPIGSSTPFSGCFDGGGHAIIGMKQTLNTPGNVGLFAYLDDGGAVKNLELKECSISANASDPLGEIHAGGIAAVVYSGTISNCSFSGTVRSNISGFASVNSTGGITGMLYGTISDCSNAGSIIAGGSNIVNAGGIAGQVYNTVRNCSNTGTLDSEAYAGGIAGSLTDEGMISSCSNKGRIEGAAGGIAGEVEDGSTIDHCNNTGSIVGGGCGGIAAFHKEGSVISYCYNTGSVTGTEVAGIAGRTSGGSAIVFCYNTGSVSASGSKDLFAAGIAGSLKDNNTVENCFNTGSISNTASPEHLCYTGGIAGEITDQWNTLSHCYNIGSIQGTHYTGGIAGLLWSSKAVSDCYYLNNTDKGSERVDTSTRVTDAQMKQQGTFIGFDFIKVWTMAGSSEYLYPELKAVPMVNIREYTVTFNSQGGSAVPIKKARYNTKITAPLSPTKSGYSFAGWYNEPACTNAWDFNKDTVTKDITLYAKWTYPAPGKPVIQSAASASYNSIKIAWKKVSRATKYAVYRSNYENGAYSKVGETSSLAYTNINLATGKTYYYKIQAYYVKGKTKVCSSYSDIKSAKPVLSAPGKMKAVRASSSSIKLTWGKVTGASGYKIERAEASNGTYVLAATIKSGTKSSYTNTKLTKGKTYYYRIRAYRTVSGKEVYSGYSRIVYAKP